MRVWSKTGFGVLAGLTLCVGVLIAGLHRSAPITPRPSSSAVYDRDGDLLRIYTSEDQGGMLRLSVKFDELPQHLIDGLVAFEDRRFYQHIGLDPIALLRATWSNLKARRVVSGASTITMQVARMLNRKPRTLSAKIQEVIHAIQLELQYSKPEILEIYFNLAPYGGNIEGVAAASEIYFGKSVSRLSLDEAATLVAIPNQPNRLRPDRNPKALKSRRNTVLQRMKRNRQISKEEYQSAIVLPIHARRRALPIKAPHFTEWLKSMKPGQRLYSTLDYSMQTRVERMLSEHLQQYDQDQISNGAVVVLDNERNEILAYVGSNDFSNVRESGQVDGVRSLRSPGSTLKPFIYALAFESGLIGKTTLLKDIPVTFPDWSPKNFDGEFQGLVPADLALTSSLNIPPISLLQDYGLERFLTFLQSAGISSVENTSGRYGLSIILGGCEVRLLDLVSAYSMLARGGKYLPPQVYLRPDKSLPTPKKVLTKESSYLTSEILTNVVRPDFPDLWQEMASAGKVSWKTGTSYARRDAWSIGYNQKYTVGVWLGNFDGRGTPELVGGRTAAPLLFKFFDSLAPENRKWISQPNTMQTRKVCALSGKAPTSACNHIRVENAVSSSSRIDTCDIHKNYHVDVETGFRLCSRCRVERDFKSEVYAVAPSGVGPWLKKSGYSWKVPPTHNPYCQHGISGQQPTIHKPSSGDHFVLRPGIPAEHQEIALHASAEGGRGKIYWFLNGRFVAESQSGNTSMLPPTEGRHELMAVDSEGRKTTVEIEISP